MRVIFKVFISTMRASCNTFFDCYVPWPNNKFPLLWYRWRCIYFYSLALETAITIHDTLLPPPPSSSTIPHWHSHELQNWCQQIEFLKYIPFFPHRTYLGKILEKDTGDKKLHGTNMAKIHHFQDLVLSRTNGTKQLCPSLSWFVPARFLVLWGSSDYKLVACNVHNDHIVLYRVCIIYHIIITNWYSI